MLRRRAATRRAGIVKVRTTPLAPDGNTLAAGEGETAPLPPPLQAAQAAVHAKTAVALNHFPIQVSHAYEDAELEDA